MAEFALEVRGAVRGYDTILFGDHKRHDDPTGRQVGGAQAALTQVESAFLPVPRQGETRYWIASSSHAEDSYLAREIVFPSVLERLLRDSGHEAVVINASRAGLDIPDNRRDLESRGGALQPNIVLLYQMSATINNLSKRLLSGADPRLRRVDEARENTTTVNKVNGVVRLFERTSLYAQIKGNVTSRLVTQRVLADSLGAQGEAEFEGLLMEFIATAKQVGATPVLCTFASSHLRKNLSSMPDSVATLVFKYNSYLSLTGWVNTIERFNQVIRRVAEREQVLLIDVEAALAGQHDLFRDYVHFTPVGHEMMAKVLYRGLMQSLTRRPAHDLVKH